MMTSKNPGHHHRAIWLGTSIVLALAFATHAQTRLALHTGSKKNLVYIDANGVMRYTSNGEEAAFFGVNYTAPFAFSYRAIKAKGIAVETAIQQDVYHMARLGFNAFRVHVWDTEISDSAGNLLNNEHLRLFDFLLAELKRRGIKTIVTPIAFWGNGYPEPDEATPGFSAYFGRSRLTTDDSAIRAQENYLQQFFKHRNPYTGLSYEADKDIIATELNNEPRHGGPPAGATTYVNRLAAAVRQTGWSKPIFYNINESPNYAGAIANARVDGFSMQWYPTGLVGGAALRGNTLPMVDAYRIPFKDTVPAFARRALMVYEFDAGDVMHSAMYPAMARSFRTAGFQWATQFAYDPMAIADVNTEYQTHYLNLAYTPAKAISMLIAAEAFRELPRSKSFGAYPADTLFNAFSVSPTHGTSAMNTLRQFYHSGPTNALPLKPADLSKIAGVGSSPIVRYEGSGAYFLDKLADGVWRLELMPDVVHLRDAFERASPQKLVSAIVHGRHAMRIELAQLGEAYTVQQLAPVRMATERATNGSFFAEPGVYLLRRADVPPALDPKWASAIGLSEFVAPPNTRLAATPVLRHEPLCEVSAGQAFTLAATVLAAEPVSLEAEVTPFGSGWPRTVPFVQQGHQYLATVPAQLVTSGRLHYRILVKSATATTSFPGAVEGKPDAWDHLPGPTYTTGVAAPGSAMNLYDASTDHRVAVTPSYRPGLQTTYRGGPYTGSLAYEQTLWQATPVEWLGFRHYVGQKVSARAAELADFDSILIAASSATAYPTVVKLALVNRQAQTFSALIMLKPERQVQSIGLQAFKPDSTLLLPRPYPGFQPLHLLVGSAANNRLNAGEIEWLDLSTAAPLQPTAPAVLGMRVEWIRLTKK
jgi:hypothetical protein